MYEYISYIDKCQYEKFILISKNNAEMLYDDSTKFWWDSPDSIAENISIPAE